MNRFEALTQFNRKSLTPKIKENIRAVDAYFRLHSASLQAQLADNFKQFCLSVAAEQQAGRKGPVAYINLSLLRMSLEERAPIYRWDAYDDTWYRDRHICSQDYDAAWALGGLEPIISDLEPERQTYAGVILPQDLSAVRQTAVKYFHNYVVQLSRLALREARVFAELQQLALADRLLILTGEYLGDCQVVYLQDERPLHSGQLKKLLESQPLHACHSFKNCDLADGHYANSNLCYATFDGSNLANSDFQHALLVGSKLRNCNLSGATLAHSSLQDADLFAANLQHANLSGIQGGVTPDFAPAAPIDLTQVNSRQELGAAEPVAYDQLNLQRANLADADFTGADLRGADLRGAVLQNTVFTDCQLQGAVFSRRDQLLPRLTPQQIAAIHWTEDEV